MGYKHRPYFLLEKKGNLLRKLYLFIYFETEELKLQN